MTNEKTPLQQVVDNIKSMKPEDGVVNRTRFHYTTEYRSYVYSVITWDHSIIQNDGKTKVVQYRVTFIGTDLHEVYVQAADLNAKAVSQPTQIHPGHFHETKWLKSVLGHIQTIDIYDKMSAYL